MPTNLFKSDDNLQKYILVWIMKQNQIRKNLMLVYLNHRETKEGLVLHLHRIGSPNAKESHVEVVVDWQTIIEDLKQFSQ